PVAHDVAYSLSSGSRPAYQSSSSYRLLDPGSQTSTSDGAVISGTSANCSLDPKMVSVTSVSSPKAVISAGTYLPSLRTYLQVRPTLRSPGLAIKLGSEKGAAERCSR